MADQNNSIQSQNHHEGHDPGGKEAEGTSQDRETHDRQAVERSSGERGSGQRGGARGGERGGERGGAGRDAGGFRIRLSDNELRAAQVVQEAFQLRSTVAALGLSIRTIAQLLEQGQLDALVAQHRSGGGVGGGGGRPEGAQRRGPRPERSGEGRGERPSSRPNPFARPSRPAPSEPAQPEAEQPGLDPAGGSEDSAPNAADSREALPSEEAVSVGETASTSELSLDTSSISEPASEG